VKACRCEFVSYYNLVFLEGVRTGLDFHEADMRAVPEDEIRTAVPLVLTHENRTGTCTSD
jgi:hypothetical protein